jgi:chitinase
MAIGGWSFSNYFSDLALTAQSRETFVRSCIDTYIKGNYTRTTTTPYTQISAPGIFDGLNVDWEYPVADGEDDNIERPADKQNFTLLLAEFRRQLDAQGALDGKRYLLTTDLRGDPGELDKHYEVASIHQYLDAIHLMTIEYNGQFAVTPRTGFQSPLYPDPSHPVAKQGAESNVDALVKAVIARGVPLNKMIVGVPWYGKLYGRVPNINNGLYQLYGSSPRGTWGVGGNLDYWDIEKNYAPKSTLYYNATAKAEWYFNGSTFVDNSGGVRAAREKAQYVRANGLAGVWLWELSMDNQTTHVLMNTVYTELL